jgi:molecular chaperone DnaK
MYLGIDLGTSNSAVVGNADGALRLFKTSDGRDVLPSALFIDRRGHRFVGTKAYDQGLLAPQNVAMGFKRLMGTSTPIMLEGSGIDLSPEEASTEILRTLVGQANAEAGEFELEGSVITVPAAFNQMQSEATIRAARAARLERVGLLQEPIAAALASLEKAKNKDGQFLVYDLGGGTFDVALVRSFKGAVTILAHEGINMLGGRDFDKSILNAVIRPWLLEKFDLPDDFQKAKSFQRLMRLAQLKGEQAKIELSSATEATIFVSEDEARTTDQAGEEIFIEVPLTRRVLDGLIEDRIDDSIALCRKVLADNGLTHEDIDRVVLIGGPSKMPTVRERVPAELGIAADLMTDPMTAVARGAAIFAESRSWDGEGVSQRKSTMGSAQTKGDVSVKYEFEARTAGNEARIKARVTSGDASGYRVSARSAHGRDTGELDLSQSPVLKVALDEDGTNRIKIIVTDVSGAPVPSASATLEIVRVAATSAGTPATHALAVKTVDSSSTTSRNHLEKLLKKGDTLPCGGSKRFRAAKTLRAGEPDSIDVEIFQQAEGVPEPELNLFVGSARINSSILDEGQVLRRGDEVVLHWSADENGLLKVSLELPSLEMHLPDFQIYDPGLGQRDFSGEDGRTLVGEALAQADNDIETLQEDLGERAAAEIAELRRRQQRLLDKYGSSDDPEDMRSVSEEARHVRQDASRLRHSAPFRKAALSAELARVSAMFAEWAHEADASMEARAEQLKSTAKSAIADQDHATAERAINELEALTMEILQRMPEFIVGHFGLVAKQRHFASDAELHDRLVERGIAEAEAGEIEALRQTIFEIYRNRAVADAPAHNLAALAGLMTH